MSDPAACDCGTCVMGKADGTSDAAAYGCSICTLGDAAALSDAAAYEETDALDEGRKGQSSVDSAGSLTVLGLFVGSAAVIFQV